MMDAAGQRGTMSIMAIIDRSTTSSVGGPAGIGAVRAAGVAGLVFATLSTATFLLVGESPPRVASAFPAWWTAYEQRYLVALYLIPFAGIAFLWLLAALRRRIGRSEDQFFATVLLGSGLLFVAMYFAAGAAASSVAVVEVSAAPEDAYAGFQVARAMARAFYFVFATKMAAAFMLVASTIGRRTGILPRWFALLGIVAGVSLLIVVTFFDPIALVFPIWVAGLSMLLLRLRPEDWATA
jgi:hypothetical protein